MGLFKNKKKDLKELSTSKTFNLFDFTNQIHNSIDPKFNSTFISICETNARHLSKIKPLAKYKGEESKKHKYLNYILRLRPNKLMSASQFWEAVAYRYYAENLSIIFCEWDYSNVKEPLKSLYPLDIEKNSFEASEQPDGDFIFRFKLNGKELYTKGENLIVLTRNADINTFLGGRNKSIDTILKLLETNYHGIEQSIKASSYLRFIIQAPMNVTDEVKKKRAEQFSRDFLQGNSSGVIYTDQGATVQPIENKSSYIKSDDMEFLEKQIFQYLGANEKILTATYNENEWQSYYETTLEPFIVKLQDELTYKLFTKFELQNENQILIESDRLQTASIQTRASIADKYLKLPLIKPNIICDLLYLPRTKNGDKEFSTLNYVQTDKQNEYQVGDDSKEVENQEQNKEELKE